VDVIKLVCDRDHPIVKTLVSRFIAADQKDRASPGIECVQNPQWSAGTLYAQFSHMRMSRTADLGAMRVLQLRAARDQEIDGEIDGVKLGFAQSFQPIPAFVGYFHIPRHGVIFLIWNYFKSRPKLRPDGTNKLEKIIIENIVLQYRDATAHRKAPAAAIV
jgi:hypothetical protein